MQWANIHLICWITNWKCMRTWWNVWKLEGYLLWESCSPVLASWPILKNKAAFLKLTSGTQKPRGQSRCYLLTRMAVSSFFCFWDGTWEGQKYMPERSWLCAMGRRSDIRLVWPATFTNQQAVWFLVRAWTKHFGTLASLGNHGSKCW